MVIHKDKFHNYYNPLFRKELDRLQLNVSEVCYSKLEEGWKYVSSKPSFTRIYAIIEGRGTIYCQDREIEMKPGNIYVLPTGMSFSYCCNTDMKKLYFHVNIPQYNGYDMLASMKGPAVIEKVADQIEAASQWIMRNGTFSVINLKAWLLQTLSTAFALTETDLGPIEEYSPLVKQTLQYIDSNLRSAISIKEIAAKLYTSESRIQKTFKAEVGKPLGKYVSDRLFFLAEEQLRTTNRSIKVISEELGFCDSFYFSRLFTKRYGIPPSRYRKQFNI